MVTCECFMRQLCLDAKYSDRPHDGRELGAFELVAVLRDIYSLSAPLAWLLVVAGFLLCGSFTIKPRSWSRRQDDSTPHLNIVSRILDLLPIPRIRLDLHDLAKHGSFRIEHDASLGHADALLGARFAPAEPDAHLVRELAESGLEQNLALDGPVPTTKGNSKVNGEKAQNAEHSNNRDGGFLNLYDVALARYRRDSSLTAHHQLSALHTRIARGECALLLSVLSSQDDQAATSYPDPTASMASPNFDWERLKVPRQWIFEWFEEERLPTGWVPPRSEVGLKSIGALVNVVAQELTRLARYS